MRTTRICAGIQSSISLLVAPASCRAPPQSGQASCGTGMTVSTRGRWAGSGARCGGLAGAAGIGSAEAGGMAAARRASARARSASSSSRPKDIWSGSSRSALRPNWARWNCLMIRRSRSISTCPSSSAAAMSRTSCCSMVASVGRLSSAIRMGGATGQKPACTSKTALSPRSSAAASAPASATQGPPAASTTAPGSASPRRCRLPAAALPAR